LHKASKSANCRIMHECDMLQKTPKMVNCRILHETGGGTDLQLRNLATISELEDSYPEATPQLFLSLHAYFECFLIRYEALLES